MSDLPIVERLQDLAVRFENNAHANLHAALNPDWMHTGTDFVSADAALYNFEQAERTRRVIAFFENLSGESL